MREKERGRPLSLLVCYYIYEELASSFLYICTPLLSYRVRTFQNSTDNFSATMPWWSERNTISKILWIVDSISALRRRSAIV